MRAPLKRLIGSLLLVACATVAAIQPASAADSKKTFKVAWSIYVGWMAWD